MTQNQINYWKLQEDKRSNLAQEKEANRHNVATEGETSRHNVATESISSGTLGETKRHNLVQEAYNISSLNESTRHNMATERAADEANKIKSVANQINQLYNDALIQIRRGELSLAQQKEVQRIVESQRDFNEAVRYHDVQGATNAITAGSNAISKLTGSSGISALTAAGLGAYGINKTLGKTGYTPKTNQISGPVAKYTRTSPQLWLIPQLMLDIQRINTISPDGSTTSGLMRN